ncbi:MAG: HAMP domain-containing histidine kinase [Defluviitaleaceae bacterium]|nr:HAMP domain-containing histidine kinase [Defluviitaleaceae bacterium]
MRKWGRNNKGLDVPLKPSRIFSVVLPAIRTLRFKLFLTYILVSVLPLFVLWGIMSNEIEEHLLNSRIGELRSTASTIARRVDLIGDYMTSNATRQFHNSLLRNDFGGLSDRFFISDQMGVVLLDSRGIMEGVQWAQPNIVEALENHHSYTVNFGDDGEVFIFVAVSIIDNNNETIGAVLLENNMVEAGAITTAVNSQIIYLIIITAITITLLVFAIASWLLNPLRRVLSAVKSFSEGDFARRILIKNKDEISALGVAFNDMAQKLESSETARQEFVSNVSHELKTPLASIKVLSESLLLQENASVAVHREFLSDINSEVDRMTDIINELLKLVRLDETELPLNIGTFNLNYLLEDCIKRLSPLAKKQNVEIELVTSHHNVNIEADEMKLTLAISNLIENALKYSLPNDQPVRVLLDIDSKNAFITVADKGIGIAEEDHNKVFARFYRADRGRDRQTGGTGLGLAITHKTILLHKGSIKLSSKLGEGCIFTVRIPLTAAKQ